MYMTLQGACFEAERSVPYAPLVDRLKPDGTLLLVEPAAAESVEGNLNPIGRLFSGGSLFICVPHALATGGTALGNQVTELRRRDVLVAAGFSRLRRAAETPFNRLFEVRP
jgi:hypothetical protein